MVLGASTIGASGSGSNIFIANSNYLFWRTAWRHCDGYLNYDNNDNLIMANIQTGSEIFIVIASATDTQIPIQFREDPVTAEDLQVVFPVEARLTAPKIIIDHNGTYAYTYVPLASPLTSTSWDGDSKTSANDGIIDLSSVFSAPAGIKAIEVRVFCNIAATSSFLQFGPTSSYDDQLTTISEVAGNVDKSGKVNCDSNGDIYVKVTGTVTNVYLQIWGYYI